VEPKEVLGTFAKLAAERIDTVPTNVLSSGATFLWQRYAALRILYGNSVGPSGMPIERGFNQGSSLRNYERRVMSTAVLHEGERQLLFGWVWFSGTLANEDGSTTKYCFPALSLPVTFGYDERKTATLLTNSLVPLRSFEAEARREGRLIAAGDVTITDLVQSREDRERLLETRNYGNNKLKDNFQPETNEYQPVPMHVFADLTHLQNWIDGVAKSIGLPVSQVAAAHQGHPAESLSNDFITVHIGSALYLEPTQSYGARSDSFLALGKLDRLDESALATLYSRSPVTSSTSTAPPVVPVRPLSSQQSKVAREVITSNLAVVTGAPGTGKSHTLSAAAMNAIAAGDSVLVVAGSPFAVDVLAEHFANTPGPPPIVFGGSRYGQQIARDLAELVSRATGAGDASIGGGSDLAEHARLLALSHRMLEVEREVARMHRDPGLRLEIAEARERAGDLNELERLVEQSEGSGVGGWVSRKRHDKILTERLGQPDDHRGALDRLRRGVDAQRIHADGGLSLSDTYDSIIRIEAAVARETGRALTEQWLNRIDDNQRTALSQISTALTSSRGDRRTALAHIAAGDLTKAAPLWIGSIRDVEEVLPEVAGLFDVLLIDEAAQIDQLNAVNALTRAKRVVICGDPHQLGHVSYMSDDDRRVLTRQELSEDEILDVGKHSLFDVGASRVPSLVLDEHFRSVPHIIEFSARRMYRDQLHVVGRKPSNEAADHIHVTHVDGSRNGDMVNVAEVEACISIAEELIAEGRDGIGFISPFAEQAQALEDAILERWQLEEIDAYGLRVATVHGFQGDEREVLIASWAIGPDEDETNWKYVNQPNLFNVMVTRARDQVYVVTSTPKPPGLAGEYLRWSEPLTNLVRDVKLTDPWIETMANVIRDAGHSVRVGYAVGRHHIDLVIDGEEPLAIDCVPHRDGPAAHTDRALQLRRMGWRTTDFFESKWRERLGEVPIELQHL